MAPRTLTLIAALCAGCAVPQAALAQSYQGADAAPAEDAAGDEAAPATGGGKRLTVAPYIEANLIAAWQISPGNDVVTYAQAAAGVDVSYTGRRSGASVSLRYERNFALSGGGSDSDTLSGLARAYVQPLPALTLEAGALASTTRSDGAGGSVIAPGIRDGFSSRTYAAYAGPTVQKQLGDVAVSANYRIGYARVDGPDVVTAGGAGADVFDDSVSHSANIRAGTSPGQPLPVGVGVGAGYYQEDVSNLDQRVRDAYVRGDVTIPVSPSLAFVAGVGVEDVEVSSRDAVRDAAGNPVVGPDGRFVTDPASPRVIAYEADGLIWDVGVVWRPSSRTSAEAHFGRRYDSTSFYGNFSWQPNSRSQLSLSVYDSIRGFGGRLTNSLALLPADLEVIRDPVTGEIIGCTSATAGAGCLDGLLGSIRSSVFRGRGASLAYSRAISRSTVGIAIGYDNRRFIGAPGTVLAAANGLTDESLYVTASASGPVGTRGSYTLASYANWFMSGSALGGDAFALGGSASYAQEIVPRLSGRAALALSMLDSDLAPEIVTATALLGLRYGF